MLLTRSGSAPWDIAEVAADGRKHFGVNFFGSSFLFYRDLDPDLIFVLFDGQIRILASVTRTPAKRGLNFFQANKFFLRLS